TAAFLLLSGFRPNTLPYTPGQPFSDAVTSHLPAAEFLRSSILEQGTFPVWRETIMGGQPFAADPLNKTAYPLQWLVLILPPVLHLDVLILLHLLIAGAGMWVWARSFGLRDEAVALSTLAYLLAPRVVGHLGAGHLDLFYALAWFPWLMWSVGQLIHGDNVGARYIVPLQRSLYVALFGGLILLADVRLSFFAYLLAGVDALYEALRFKHIRSLLWLLPAGVVVILLTLSFSLPLIAWQPYLSRGGMTAADAGVFSLDPAQLIGLLLPIHSGNIETLTYLGLPVLILAIIGAINRRKWFWVAATVVAALYALGLNGFLWQLLVKLIPALLWFRVPSRAWFVVALIAPLLAGFGLQQLIEHPPRRGTLIALIGTVIAFVAGVFFALSVKSINGLAIIVGGGGIGLSVLLTSSGRLAGNRLALALIAVTFLDLALSGFGWLEWRPQEVWLPPDQAQLAERLTELGAYRVYSPTYSLQQQVAEEYHLRLFGGVDPFQLNGIVAAVEQGGGTKDTDYSVVLPPQTGSDLAMANQGDVPNTAVLGEWGVTHVVSAYPLNVPNLTEVDQVDGTYIYANHDPALTTNFGSTPAWPSGWPGLPDAATVAQLNQTTQTATLISGAALIVLLGTLGVLKVRQT
ncbi:MAG TPA: hypothetical protein VHD90_05510, partial [Phototrophicaceae bacterium]|nr:hypothetical protein [Phototrophicaceae bacterium]